ncbi:MAG: hypothetical protein ABIZ52_01535 [Candidatus Limnocylindrales bacterium]
MSAARIRRDADVGISVEHDDVRWRAPGSAKALVTWTASERAIDLVVWLVNDPARAESFRLPDPA